MINIFYALCTNTRARIFNLPCGEYTLKLIGKFEMPLEEPVTLSVSSSISLRIDKKSINFLPLQCRNSPYSVGPLINWRISGRLVTIPFPLGRKSLKNNYRVKKNFFLFLRWWILAFFQSGEVQIFLHISRKGPEIFVGWFFISSDHDISIPP